MEQFSTGSLISFGWESFKKRPWFFIGATLLTMILSIAAGAVAGFFADSDGTGNAVSFIANLLLSTLVGIGVTAFFLKAVTSLEAVSLRDLWHPQGYFKYLGASILLQIVILVGLVLLIIPGVILGVMFMFTPYLVVEKGLGPIAAMKESARITRGKKWELFVLVLASLALNIVGALLLLVGLFVAVPLTMMAMARAYKLLEGASAVSLPASAASSTPTPTVTSVA